MDYLVRSLVDDPEAVVISQSDRRRRGRGVLIEVRTGPGDMGRVIGKAGKTAQAIRSVVRAAATRDGVEVDVDFVD
ncbi:MAG: KH domain-containing protein [Acidimicrobiales bacterium]